MTIGEANRRSIQNQPRNEFPWFTEGTRRAPRHMGAVRLRPRRVWEYLVYAVSDFRMTRTSKSVGIKKRPPIKSPRIKSPNAYMPP
jgi:hypothetical protein